MDEQKLRAELGAMDIALTCYESTDSTNLRAKEWARRGGELPAAFFADAQTAGRGRLGRCFLSPAGGLYMSVALDCGGTHPGSLTTLAAAAVLRAGDWQGLISDMPAGEWDSLMALNLRGAFILSREAVRHMRPLGGGSILLISSVQAAGGASCESAYAASKAGLIGLCRSLAREWGPCGIRVNCLSPGVIDAGMMDAFSPEDKEALRRDTPLQRLGRLEDVAEAALFLSSEKAAFITGQVLGVDGGLVV